MAKEMTPMLLELGDAISEAAALTSQPTLSKRDESRVNFLLAKIKTLRDGVIEDTKQDGVRSDPAYERAFRAYLSNRPVGEVCDLMAGSQTVGETRDLMAGSQTVTYLPA